MAGFNRSTIEFAKECISLFRASGVAWPELSSPERLVGKIERQLSKQKLDNLLDVEDILNQLLYDVMVLGRYAKLGSAIKFTLTNTGNAKSDKASPSYKECPELSNDDDLQGLERNPNTMDTFFSRDGFPGSELHLAKLDIEERFGYSYVEVLELKLSGETEKAIAEHMGVSREAIKRAWGKVKSFLRDGGYDMQSIEDDAEIISWNKSRKQSERTWDLPLANHRSIYYKE